MAGHSHPMKRGGRLLSPEIWR